MESSSLRSAVVGEKERRRERGIRNKREKREGERIFIITCKDKSMKGCLGS
jgi:hypothetical protein